MSSTNSTYFPPSAPIELTYSAAQTLITNGTVKKGQQYFITDKADAGIYLTGLDATHFATEAIAGFLNPDYYGTGNYSGVIGETGTSYTTSVGIWQVANEGSWSNGDITIWYGLHYQLTNSLAIDGTSPNINNSAYSILSKSLQKVGYILEVDAIEYDFDNNWIQSREDKRGNKVKLSFAEYNLVSDVNPFELFQWGNNNVADNTIEKYAICNCLNNLGVIVGNLFSGVKDESNSCNINLNLGAAKQIFGCQFLNSIADLSAINVNYKAKTLSPHLSTFDANINITGLSTLVIPGYIGIIRLSSDNNFETINNFDTAPTFKRLFTFVAGGTLTSVIFSNANTILLPTPSTSTTLSTSNDFIELLWNGGAFIQTASEQY